MSKPDTPEIKGCTDHGCIFGHPGGMGTNGGCGCMKELNRSGERGRQMQRNILALRKEIQNLRDVREELRHALEHICACTDTKMCPDCRRLTNTVMERPKGRNMVGGYQDTPEGRKWLLDDPGKA